jgi:hypothetical protein
MARFRFQDEGAHTPAPDDPIWQESQIFIWWDDTAGVGGLHRVGQLPNQGTANLWSGLITADGTRYLADRHDIALNGSDRTDRGLSSGGQSMCAGDEHSGSVEFVDDEAELHLRYVDFYPMCEVWEHGTGGQVEAEMAAAHFETSGRVTGTVRLGERTIDVNGTFHRDHSWGPRDWEYLTGHRWVVGTAGREFSFSSAVMLGTSDIVSGGYIIRDGERFQATDIDIVIGIEPDNVTARNATVTWTLTNGESVTIDCEPVDGWMFGHGNYLESDQLARFSVRGEDIRGWCDIEVSMNHRLHNQPVRLALGAALERGLSRARQRIGLFEKLAVR